MSEPLPDSQEHNRDRDRWERNVPSIPRDPAADRETRLAIRNEAHGEYDADGHYCPSTWT